MTEAPKRRRESPETRRAQILAAAKRSFGARGLQTTTVENIASEAGVSVGLVYRLFESKAAVVEAIIIEEVGLQLSDIEAALQEAKGDLDRLPDLIARNVSEVAVDHARTALMLELTAEVCRSPDLQDFLQRKRAELHEALAAMFKTRGLGKADARRLLGRLDWASAIASGLAVHEVVYGTSLPRSRQNFSKLFETISV